MIVLDTHAWLWWVSSPNKLSERARQAIDGSGRIAVSTLSCWEIAMLAERGRIELDRPPAHWVRSALRADERTVAVAPDTETAVRSATLEGFHGDPADRFIYSTAITLGASLVTRDKRIRAFDRRRTVW